MDTREQTNHFESSIYLAFPIWTVAQGNQIAEEKLVVLLIHEGGMTELGHHHFEAPNDLNGSEQRSSMTADITKSETKRPYAPLKGGTQYCL